MTKEISAIKPSLSYLYEALALFEDIFALSCKALELSIDEPVSPYKPIHGGDFVIETLDMDCGDNDDTSWFFDDEPSSAPDAGAPLTECIEAATSDRSAFSTDSSLRSADGLADFSDAWLVIGLQHCLLHDWHDRKSNRGVDHVDTDIALPMRLAAAAATHLWSQHSCSGAHSLPVGFTLLETAQNIAHSRERVDPVGGVIGRLRRPLQALYLHTVHGVQAERSCIQRNAVVFSTTMARLSLALSFDHRNCHVGDNNCHGDDDGGGVRCVSFRGVVILKPDLIDFGEEADTTTPDCLGTSQQARAVSFTTVLTVNQAVHRYQQESRGDSHLQRVVVHLSRLGVSLVLCSQEAYSDRLADACAVRHIALLPLRNRQLEIMSCASSVNYVESLLGLRPDDVGFQTSGLRLQMLMETPPQDCDSARGVDLRGDTQVLAADDDHGHGQNTVLACLTVLPGGEPPLGNLSASAHADGLVDGSGAVLPLSVTICAPTAIMAACISDRFHRCLHRLRVVLESGGGVMPGAGLPELLCSVCLEDLVRRRLSSAVAASDSDTSDADSDSDSDGDSADNGSVVTSLLSGFQRALDTYSLTVLRNNGATYPEALAATDAARSSLRQSHQLYDARNAKSGGEPSCVLDFVSSLTTREKLRLMGPIDIEGIPGMGGFTSVAARHVLEVREVKVQAMRAALDAVRQVAASW